MPRYFDKTGPAFNPDDIPTFDPREHPSDQQYAEGMVIRLPRGGYLMRCQRTRSWRLILKEDVRSGQSHAYADTINESLFTFSGGSPSALPGWHMPFATMPPFDDGPQPGRMIFDKHSHLPEAEAWEMRRRDHEQRIKDMIWPLMRWVTDKTVIEPRDMGHAWLDAFECVAALPFSTTWRVKVVIPYMD